MAARRRGFPKGAAAGAAGVGAAAATAWLHDEDFAARDAEAAAAGYAKLMTVVEQAAERDWRPALEMAKRGHGFSERVDTRVEHTGTVVHAHVPVHTEDDLRAIAGAIREIPAAEAPDEDVESEQNI